MEAGRKPPQDARPQWPQPQKQIPQKQEYDRLRRTRAAKDIKSDSGPSPAFTRLPRALLIVAVVILCVIERIPVPRRHNISNDAVTGQKCSPWLVQGDKPLVCIYPESEFLRIATIEPELFIAPAQLYS